jgi:hypothetical protein
LKKTIDVVPFRFDFTVRKRDPIGKVDINNLKNKMIENLCDAIGCEGFEIEDTVLTKVKEGEKCQQ